MNKQEKIFEVENISAKIKSAKALALTDYRGITVAQISDLREKIKDAGGELQVLKNTLLLRALRLNKYKIGSLKIEGPTLVLFANADEIAPIKTLAVFAKSVDKLPFKLGFMGGNLVSADDLKKYASIPPKIELQAKLVGLLFSQPTRLAYALNWNIQRLALVLSKIKKDN